MLSGKYYDPKNDIAFKKLFGSEDNKMLLISFLNAILGLENDYQIKKVKFLKTDQLPVNRESKTSLVDVHCIDKRNVQYIVEMQNRSVPDFLKRVQYYNAHAYARQPLKGLSHVELKPIILIAITNYDVFPKKQKVVSYHKVLDVDTGENDLGDMTYVFVDLSKFNKTEKELESVQDKWIYFLKNCDEDAKIPTAMKEEEIKDAYESMEQFNWEQPSRDAYFKLTLAMRSQAAVEEEKKEDGKREEKISLAKKLLKEDFSIEKICEYTGLSEKDIKNII